jgi:hypothetical protein
MVESPVFIVILIPLMILLSKFSLPLSSSCLLHFQAELFPLHIVLVLSCLILFCIGLYCVSVLSCLVSACLASSFFRLVLSVLCPASFLFILAYTILVERYGLDSNYDASTTRSLTTFLMATAIFLYDMTHEVVFFLIGPLSLFFDWPFFFVLMLALFCSFYLIFIVSCFILYLLVLPRFVLFY